MESCTSKAAKKQRDKRAENTKFQQVYSSLPPNTCVAFTDGSSFGNPGPAGAGFTVLPSLFHPGACSSVYLGEATNNVAELAALQFVCDSLFELFSSCAPSSRPSVCVFVDNRYATDAANNTNKCKANRKQVAETRRAVSALRTLTEVSIRWVPAHAGVGGNEVADSLAKRGAKGTTSRAPLSPPTPSPPSRRPLDPAVSSPSALLHPDLELADDMDDMDDMDEQPPPGPLLAPQPQATALPPPPPDLSLRRSPRIHDQIRALPTALYRRGKVDFSMGVPKAKPVHRQRAPSRDVTSQTPDLSYSPPNVHIRPSARKKRKAPQLPPQPIRGLGHFGWKRPCIPPHSSGLSPSPPSLTSPESSPFRPPDHRKRTLPDPPRPSPKRHKTNAYP